jgi:hypothetical protein
MDHRIPERVLTAATGWPDATVIECRREALTGSSGAATGAVTRLSGRVRCGDEQRGFSLIRKEVRPVTEGRHAPYASAPDHWAYWRREPLAYASGLLPTGPGIAAPGCFGVVDDVVYLAVIDGPPESPDTAARRLGAWQASAPIPEVPWLARHQLAQRIAASRLDWNDVDLDPRTEALWARRHELLAGLANVPRVLSHGDFSIGNLIASTPATTTVLDWATLGTAPVGADLASLALSALRDLLPDYLTGLDGRHDPTAVDLGYRTTLALTGASRLHWMRSRGVPVPPGYEQFVLSLAP